MDIAPVYACEVLLEEGVGDHPLSVMDGGDGSPTSERTAASEGGACYAHT